MTVIGHDAQVQNWKRTKTMTVTDQVPQQNVVHNEIRETFTVDEAREAMGTPWMSMKGMSQCIPPSYATFIGKQLRELVNE